jgi:hypothetical protein
MFTGQCIPMGRRTTFHAKEYHYQLNNPLLSGDVAMIFNPLSEKNGLKRGMWLKSHIHHFRGTPFILTGY